MGMGSGSNEWGWVQAAMNGDGFRQQYIVCGSGGN